MPTMNGIDATIKIKEICKKTNKETRIIMTSAFNHESEKQFALRSGVDFYLEKPLTYNKLKNVLD